VRNTRLASPLRPGRFGFTYSLGALGSCSARDGRGRHCALHIGWCHHCVPTTSRRIAICFARMIQSLSYCIFSGQQQQLRLCSNCSILCTRNGGLCARCLALPYCRNCHRHLPTNAFDIIPGPCQSCSKKINKKRWQPQYAVDDIVAQINFPTGHDLSIFHCPQPR